MKDSRIEATAGTESQVIGVGRSARFDNYVLFGVNVRLPLSRSDILRRDGLACRLCHLHHRHSRGASPNHAIKAGPQRCWSRVRTRTGGTRHLVIHPTRQGNHATTRRRLPLPETPLASVAVPGSDL